MSYIALEEYELMKDSKYRVYVSAVDKALKSFEYTSEWADLISALGKLNKVLLNHLKFPVIPRRIKISKRLAQCMHPALPSGVHLKALETYDIIFKCMGTNRLSHELFIYSAGLFPLLGNAAMNVRPSLLTVYETHFVPLGERLRPGLSGFLSGVLPGLEEGSDYFERTNSLLEKVCDGVGGSHFYGCLWECLASNVAIRLPAISFVLSHFNKKLSMEDQLHIMGTNIDVMVSALCAALQDASVLVQRSTLDLLLVGFPMHSSHLVRSDQGRLVTAALTTVLRRDMSLNRRLFAWLLGSEVNMNLMSSEHPLVKRSKITDTSQGSSCNPYFDLYSRDMLIQAIKVVLNTCLNESVPDLRPYRLLVSLLDKPDIGPLILDDILYEVFRTLYLACEISSQSDYKLFAHKAVKSENMHKTTSYKGSQELLKTANLLFSTLEPFYIWQYAGSLFENACKSIKDKQNHVSVSSKSPAVDQSINIHFSNLSKAQKEGDIQAKATEHCLPQHGDIFQSAGGIVKAVGATPPDVLEVCALTEFLLDMVSLETYVEIPTEHLPELFLKVVTILITYCGSLSLVDITSSLGLCQKILSKVQPSSNFSQDHLQPKKSISDASKNIGYKIPSQSSFNQGHLVRQLSDGDGTNFQFLEANDLKPKHPVSRSRSASDVFDKRHGSEVGMDSDGEGESLKDTTDDTFESAVEAGNSEDLWLEGAHNEAEAFGVSSAGSKQQSVMQECLRQYEDFYVKFICSRVFDSKVDVFLLFTLLLVPRNETDKDRTLKLLDLLRKCVGESNSNGLKAEDLKSDKTCSSYSMGIIGEKVGRSHIFQRDSCFNEVLFEKSVFSNGDKIKEPFDGIDKASGIIKFKKSDPDLLEEAVRRACNLLVELSTFPTYLSPGSSAFSSLSNNNQKECEQVRDANLPRWLQVLLVCCCMGEANSSIQLTSVATFLDLIALLRSFTLTAPEGFSQCEELLFGSIEDSKSISSSIREIVPKFENIPASDGVDRGVVSVVIVPLLTPYHFHFLEQRTNVFRSVAESLWSCLGRLGSARPWAVRLLYLLHNAVPEGCQDVVEDVILESMVNLGSAEAFDRFTALWHLGRDVEGVSGSRVPVLGDRSAGRSFDRALLRCLDALALLPASPARLRTEAWLLHSLLRGDASRILEPLLLMLLEPSTARIGILHMKLQGPGQSSSPSGSPGSIHTDSKSSNFEETVESKIYAVSSVDGNVKYHVSGHSGAQPLFSRPSHVPRRIFAITSLQRGRKQKNGRSETESAVHSRRYIAKDSIEASNGVKGSMSVFVNPFSSSMGTNDDVKRDSLKFSESDPALERENAQCLRVGASCSDLTESGLSSKAITLKSESLSAPSVVELKSPSPDKSWCEMNIVMDESDSDTESSGDDVEEAEVVVADESRSATACDNGKDGLRKTSSDSVICKEDSSSTGVKVVEEILQDVLHTVVERCEGDEAIEAQERRMEGNEPKEENRMGDHEDDMCTNIPSSKAMVYPLHSHMLLYVKAYDSHRALYALSTFANLLRADARTVLCAAAAAGISTGPRGALLQSLLACHRESVFGRGFNCGSSSSAGKSGKEEKSLSNVYGEGSSSASISDTISAFPKSNGSTVGRSSDVITRESSSAATRVQRGESTIQASHRLSSSAPTLTSIPSMDTTSSSASSFRTCRLLEVAMVVCLYYIRSYYPNFLVDCLNKAQRKADHISKTNNFPSDLEFISNRKARLLSAEVLTLIAAELVQLCGGPGSVVCNGTAGHLASGVGRGFASYVGDLMNRCKVQKITLHCILSSVNSMKNCSVASSVLSALAKKIRNSTFAEEIIRLNDEKYVEEVHIDRKEGSRDTQECHSAHSESFQIQLLRLLLFLIMLEDQVNNQAADDETLSREPATLGNPQEEMIVHLKYRSGLSIPQQPMFLAAVMNALKLDHIRHLHQHWTSLITSALPYMGHSLTHVVINVINQLCCNLEKLSQFYKLQYTRCSDRPSKESLLSAQLAASLNENLPPDYALTQLDSLTLLCHYCLLDSTPSTQQPIFSFTSSSSSSSSNGVSSASPAPSNGQPPSLAVGSAGVVGGNGSGSSVVIPGQIFSNLVHVFMPAPLSQDGAKDKSQGSDPRIAARRTVLCNFPRIIASLSTLWEAVTKSLNETDDHCYEEYPGGSEGTCGLVLGRRRLVRQHLLEFLSPISLHHGSHFLAAVAIAWQERKETNSIEKVNDACKVLSAPTKEQQVLVDLLSSIRAMPVDTLVQTVHNVLRQPPAVVVGGSTTTNGAQSSVLEVSLLEFLYCYLRKSTTARQLVDSWPSLAVLLREGSAASTSSPPAHFLMLALLNEFVQRASPLPEKKDQRELQDITAKLVEVVGQVAGACLEQTTWLRRNLSVKEEVQQDTLGYSSKLSKDSKDSVALGENGISLFLMPAQDPLCPTKSSIVLLDKDILFPDSMQQTTRNGSNGHASISNGVVSTAVRHSVTAQLMLAEYLAPLLDVTYGSQEKERVVTLLTGVMYNITPYLKNHSPRNASSFLACSKLLASISGYQYTRRAWRKDAFDLLLDPSLFKMPPSALMYWHTIIDNLMTHDTTTFRDLMARVSMAQSGSLSLFSSREQEYEQRAQLLKRLAFVIFCSETDQYQKYMPEIQERLADSLRLPQVVPSVQAQVFLCFRVLLLRMSPSNITSLWPTIISEMVQVFLLIEREFTADSEEFSSHIRLLSMLDSSWVVNSSNGLHAHGHPAWLHLQLAACKLLDLAILLPAHRLPQFQMYRWAFVGGVGAAESRVRNDGEEQTNGGDGEDKIKSHEFVPHVTRIARLMNKKLNKQSESPIGGGKLLLTMSSIRSIKELHPFFSALSESNFSTAAICSSASFAPFSCNALIHNSIGNRREGLTGENSIVSGKDGGESATISHIEAVLESDFLEQFLK